MAIKFQFYKMKKSQRCYTTMCLQLAPAAALPTEESLRNVTSCVFLSITKRAILGTQICNLILILCCLYDELVFSLAAFSCRGPETH